MKLEQCCGRYPVMITYKLYDNLEFYFKCERLNCSQKNTSMFSFTNSRETMLSALKYWNNKRQEQNKKMILAMQKFKED
jgi:hypothetical protein